MSIIKNLFNGASNMLNALNSPTSESPPVQNHQRNNQVNTSISREQELIQNDIHQCQLIKKKLIALIRAIDLEAINFGRTHMPKKMDCTSVGKYPFWDNYDKLGNPDYKSFGYYKGTSGNPDRYIAYDINGTGSSQKIDFYWNYGKETPSIHQRRNKMLTSIKDKKIMVCRQIELLNLLIEEYQFLLSEIKLQQTLRAFDRFNGIHTIFQNYQSQYRQQTVNTNSLQRLENQVQKLLR